MGQSRADSDSHNGLTRVTDSGRAERAFNSTEPRSVWERARLPRRLLRKMPLEMESREKRHLLPGWRETSKTTGQLAQGAFPKGGLGMRQVHSNRAQPEQRGTN